MTTTSISGTTPLNHTFNGGTLRRVIPSHIRGLQGVGATFVNESGHYKLILRSDKGTAKPFSRRNPSVSE